MIYLCIVYTVVQRYTNAILHNIMYVRCACILYSVQRAHRANRDSLVRTLAGARLLCYANAYYYHRRVLPRSKKKHSREGFLVPRRRGSTSSRK